MPVPFGSGVTAQQTHHHSGQLIFPPQAQPTQTYLAAHQTANYSGAPQTSGYPAAQPYPGATNIQHSYTNVTSSQSTTNSMHPQSSVARQPKVG
jgi:hypothetical protein